MVRITYRRPVVIAGAVFLLTAILLTAPVPRAAALSGLGLSPAIKEVSFDSSVPEATFDFAITNHNKEETEIRLSALDFGALDETGGIAFIGKRLNDPQTKYGLRQWLGFSVDTVVLRPGEKRTVTATVFNKESLSPGGHYGAIVVTPQMGEKDFENVQLVPSASILVIAKKQGGEVYNVNVNRITVSGGWFRVPGDTLIRFQNAGNVHVVPRGTVTMRDPWSRLVSKGTINEDSGLLLPESFRQFTVSSKRMGTVLWPGKYTVTVNARYDDGTQAMSRTASVWYVGSPIVIVLATALVGGGTGLVFWRRRVIMRFCRMRLRQVFPSRKH